MLNLLVLKTEESLYQKKKMEESTWIQYSAQIVSIFFFYQNITNKAHILACKNNK